MKKSLSILMFIGLIVVSGCSHSTLKEAIDNSGLAQYDEPEILYRNDDEGIVIFLTKDAEGSYIVCRGTYTKKNDRFKVDDSSHFARNVDIVNKYEFLTIDSIEDESNNPKRFIWGGVFHYPQAEKVQYIINDEEGNELHQNSTEINNKHIFLDTIPDDVKDLHEVNYQVLDAEGNILYDQS
ncbi:hypothetical protein GMD78_10820 [Ornithinibacillus sp. L9]|uniref:Lipoprotein n=1 Tax=Ornithinibacillus caprae TaxID=2678566 RepID=A0A6N8FHG4_9BACI|nr:hypothetical protein [Ornithinibacillus caprae]MUK88885.1 hypothetical protein [Ornithinibacillus caprae]